MGLYRRKHKSSAREAVEAISSDLKGPANCIGYQQMHRLLRNDHQLVIDRETVRVALKVMDPDGVSKTTILVWLLTTRELQ